MFITAHIINIIMQAVMLEKALFKVPHECGWFEAPHHVDASDADEDTPRKETENNIDDYFKAIN